MPPATTDMLDQLKKTETPPGKQMQLQTITMQQLSIYIYKTKNNASAGADSINGTVLRDIFPLIKQTLLHLVNLSLSTGCFPQIFKETKIIPQCKIGKDPLLVESYRPVCNLSVIGKILERAMFNHHGGRAGHSTSTCLLGILEKVNQAKENKMCVAILATDLSSAFDLCCHSLMKEKCRLLKIGEDGLNWLSNFLNNRTQYVDLGGGKSTSLKTGDYGVIQGSPSSGELFNYFLNDLPDQVKTATEKTPIQEQQDSASDGFVDDLSVVSQGKNQVELMARVKQDYHKIEEYLINNKMVINPAKTQLMTIKANNIDPNVSFNIRDDIIHNQQSIKILGVTLTSELTFDEHLWQGKKSMAKVLNTKISLLKTVKPFLSTKTMANVGASMINSTISYASAVWGTTTQQNI